MDINVVSELMSKEGPIVSAVLLRVDGKLEQVTLDMTPKKNELVTFFKGQPTIIGKYELVDCVLMKKRDAEPKTQTNSHKLPHPHHENDHAGDILLIKMNELAEPEDFTKEEWTAFLKTAPFSEEAYKQWLADHKLDEDDEEEDDDEEEEAQQVSEEEVLKALAEAFEEQNGRKPTKKELALFREALANEEEEEDDEDEGEILTKEEATLLQDVMNKLGEDPTEEQIEKALGARKGGKDLWAKLSVNRMLGDDDDEEFEEEEEEEEEPPKKVAKKSAPAKKNQRR